MLSKSSAKLVNSLKIKKFRQKYGQFIAEGDKTVKELLTENLVCVQIFASEAWISQNSGLIINIENDKINEVSELEMKKISDFKTPSEVLGVFEIPRHDPDFKSNNQIIVLDNIRDPGNLGTIIRTADWFGFSLIVCSENCVDAFNPKTVQSSMGSIARIKIVTSDLKEFKQHSKDHLWMGAALSEQSVDLYEASFPDRTVLVIGSESHGLSPTVIELCDSLVKIPRTGHAESLNASIAAAVLMAEIRRTSFFN